MFTGIIKEVGVVVSIKEQHGGKLITIKAEMVRHVDVDQSISINGVCHTAVSTDEHTFTVESVEETLRKSNMGNLQEGNRVNLEPSLHPKQLLDGHLVQGHVDTTGGIENIEKEGTDYLLTISYPPAFNDLLVGRGSICVDGISLTIASLGETTFTVAIIPYTYEHTNMRQHDVEDTVNIEFDIIGKYVARYLENRSAG